LCNKYGSQDYKRGDGMSVRWYWEADDVIAPFSKDDSRALEPLFRAFKDGKIPFAQRVMLSFASVDVDLSQMTMKTAHGFV
jgi:hypothetical protein